MRGVLILCCVLLGADVGHEVYIVILIPENMEALL